ncbi:MAG TPA: CHAT domain-containing protein [Thermoanaerobaculia bacterium]|nr:CHAT domain-containing protein [Thermoanaerobaculia bacterium]
MRRERVEPKLLRAIERIVAFVGHQNRLDPGAINDLTQAIYTRYVEDTPEILPRFQSPPSDSAYLTICVVRSFHEFRAKGIRRSGPSYTRGQDSVNEDRMSGLFPITGCPDDEKLAALVDGHLEPPDRRCVIEHMTSCANCRSIVLIATEFKVADDSASVVTSTRSRRTLIVVVTASVIAIVLGIRTHERVDRPNAAIVALARIHEEFEYRPVSGRISGFVYRPEKPLLRDRTPPDSTSPSIRLNLIVSELQSDRKNAHALGVAYIMMGNYDKAVATLESVARIAPGNAYVLSDLSAAYAARATVHRLPFDSVAALDRAERAWRLRPTAATAWNRAMAVSSFHLVEAGGRAWDDFLEAETDTRWRSEALQRRADLHTATEFDEWRRVEPKLRAWAGRDDEGIAAVVRRFPARASVYFEETLLPLWAREHVTGSSAATTVHHLATVVARTLATTGDRFAADTIAAIDSVCHSAQSCDAIASAHIRFAEGRALMDAEDFNRAETVLTEAKLVFDRHSSPYAWAARFRLGACMLHGNRFAAARATGNAVVSAIATHDYRTLHGRTLCLLGLGTLHAGRPEESIGHYGRARALFTEGEDLTNLGSVELLLADAYEYAGESSMAMERRLAGLAALRRSGDIRQTPVGLFEGGTSISLRGWPDAGDYLLAEAARQSLKQQRFAIATVASIWRSVIASRRNDFDVATAQARLASIYGAETRDPGQRALIAATVNQATGTARETVQAAEKLTEAIHFFEQAGNRAWLPQLLRQRALARQREGNLEAAEADLRKAIDVAEEVLDGAAPATMRDGFASDVRANYEDMIGLLLQQGSMRDALAYAERARLIGHGRIGDLDVLKVIETLPPSTAVAMYEIQPDALIVWLIMRNTITLFRSPGARDVADRIAALDGPLPTSTSTVLYDLLLRSWLPHVPPETELVVIPPPVLTGVPFSALLNRDSGRFVIADYTVTVATSLASLAERSSRLSRSDSVLIVGDPAYRALPRLHHSGREALAVARHYTHPITLTDEEATATAFLAHLERADALHFGGHAIVNDLAPELSSIMLASADDGEDSRIYVHELLAHRHRLKLVVLSACSTAKSRRGDARGTLTIARAFLDGGAEMVVGTLWPVPDETAASFSTALHNALSRGEDISGAVRSAQKHLKSTSRGDQTWAAFCAFKGSPRQGDSD